MKSGGSFVFAPPIRYLMEAPLRARSACLMLFSLYVSVTKCNTGDLGKVMNICIHSSSKLLGKEIIDWKESIAIDDNRLSGPLEDFETVLILPPDDEAALICPFFTMVPSAVAIDHGMGPQWILKEFLQAY